MADTEDRERQSVRPGRGHLRIYLGSAAGVGKTYAMLCEGHRRAERGADVVVAFGEAHGPPHPAAPLDGLAAIAGAADQVELVDMTPEALRRRMAHGNIYPPEKIDAALTNYFRSGNLAALRELALLWLADKVDEGLQRYRAEHKITGAWEARERVVVALTGGPEGRTLIRRAARIAARSAGGDLPAVHVTKSDGLTGADPAALASQRRLVESVGGTYHQVVGDDISEALLTFSRAENATQLVLGASRRSWLTAMLTGPGISARTIRGSGDIDVHIVTHGQMGRGRGLPRPRGAITRRRKVAGYVLAAALLPVLTVFQ